MRFFVILEDEGVYRNVEVKDLVGRLPLRTFTKRSREIGEPQTNSSATCQLKKKKKNVSLAAAWGSIFRGPHPNVTTAKRAKERANHTANHMRARSAARCSKMLSPGAK
jgi:hypothetical protein